VVSNLVVSLALLALVAVRGVQVQLLRALSCVVCTWCVPQCVCVCVRVCGCARVYLCPSQEARRVQASLFMEALGSGHWSPWGWPHCSPGIGAQLQEA